MDVRIRTIVAAIFAAWAVAYPAPSAARQDPVTERSEYVTDSGNVVHCVATASGRTYCGTERTRYVIRGAPPATCIEGTTWGYDDRGTWVSGECVADFVVRDNDAPGGGERMGSPGHPLHCESLRPGRTYCGRPHVNYAIRSPANPRCVGGSTWGSDARGLWVSGGCIGDFDDASGGGHRHEVYAGPFVRCTSNDSGRTFCGQPHTHYVIRGTPDPVCVQGKTWDYDDEHGIWVTGGCTATFDVINDND